MIELDADENRYLVRAGAGDAVALRRIPGHRYNPAQRGWQFPRQAGVVLALDHVFGAGAWRAHGDLGIEIAEVRGRTYPPAQNDAFAELDGAQLAIECSIADKELVKVVPGYRWSPAQRRWFVAAAPLALELLRERFGDHLKVSAAAQTYIELRRIDEEHAAEHAPGEPAPLPAFVADAARPYVPVAPVVEPAIPPRERADAPAADESAAAEADVTPSLSVQMARLTEAVDGLRLVLEAVLPRLAPAGVAAAPMTAEAPETDESPSVEPDGNGAGTWRELFADVGDDPSGVLDTAMRRIQTADPGQDTELRAVAGVAAVAVHEFDVAMTQLRTALTRDGALADATLANDARDAYLTAALALVTADCGPVRPIATTDAFREMLLAELSRDGGFDDATIGSTEARSRLEFLVNDPVLRRVSPVVSDYCRVAHLLGVSRSGAWMQVERVADVLRDTSLRGEGLAFATILFANVLVGEPCIEEWEMSFPERRGEAFAQDFGGLTERLIAQLPGLEPNLARDASLACLRCLAEAPAECATADQRRALVAQIPGSSSLRRYGEFLAAFPLAARGQRSVGREFPGYVEILAAKSLEQTAPHILDVFVQDSGGPGSLARLVAENVIVASVRDRGLTDPQTQLIDLLDILKESPRVDNLLNDLGRLVEDAEFPGADAFTRDQRKTLYRRALQESIEKGHDHDMREAFNRLVRELQDEGARPELRTLAAKYQNGPKHLRIGSLVLLLEALLQEREPFRDTLEALVAANAARTAGDEDDVVAELQGLSEVFPEVDEPLRELLKQRGAEPTTSVVHPDVSGKHVVVIGGHQWLKKQALPVLVERWRLKVDWLEPQVAKNGPQALGLAGGAADLVIINTSCIGHAASGRARAEALAVGKPFLNQPSHGVGSLLTFVRAALAGLEPGGEQAARPLSRMEIRRKLVKKK
jgi:hypothetical protein